MLVDESFGTQGQVILPASADMVLKSVVALDVTVGDNIMVGGSLRFSDYVTFSDPFVQKLDSEGSLDLSFGDQGWAILKDSTVQYDIRSMIVCAGEKALLCGERFDAAGASSTLIRFTAFGELDSSFANNGVYTYSDADGLTWTNSIAELSDGRIIVLITSRPKVTLLCLLPNGTLDPTFGTGGVFKYDYQGLPSGGWKLAIDDQDRIVVAGSIGSFLYPSRMLCARVLNTGQLDTSFGQNGFFQEDNLSDQTYSAGEHGEALNAIEIGANGVIYMVGYFRLTSTNNSTIRVYALTDSGTLDTNFNGQGYLDVVNDINIENRLARALVVNPQNVVHVACVNGGNSQHQMSIITCDSTGASLDAHNGLYVNDIAFDDTAKIYNIYLHLALQSSGRLLVPARTQSSAALVGFTPNFTTSVPVAHGQSQTSTEVILYPNPATSYFKVESNGAMQVRLLDAMGRIVSSYESQSQYQIPAGIAPGIYFVRIDANSGVHTMPLLVE